MRMLYVLLLVTAVILSSIDASTATTETSINSRRLVSAGQDKTDGKRFLRAEVKEEDFVDEEERFALSSPFSGIAKSAKVAATKVRETASTVKQTLAAGTAQMSSNSAFKEILLKDVYNGDKVSQYIYVMKLSNQVNPEVNMVKTLTKNLGDVNTALWIQHFKNADDIIKKMQAHNFRNLEKKAKQAKKTVAELVGESEATFIQKQNVLYAYRNFPKPKA